MRIVHYGLVDWFRLGAVGPWAMLSRERLSVYQPGHPQGGPMAKPERRDSMDCLIAELTDAYKALVRCEGAWDETQDILIKDATASIERAFQVVSDLQAERA
jgi:hypothetical protein